MSRIGRQPVPIPKNVTVQVDAGARTVTVKGPLDTLEQDFRREVAVVVEDNTVVVRPVITSKQSKAMHGLYRQLVNNMVIGVTEGFQKTLEIVGVGYRAAVKGKDLTMQIGYPHPVVVPIPDGLSLECPNPTSIIIKGADKQAVGQFAATIRHVRKPEPYKGKGIRYKGEQVRRLQGKTFTSGSGG